MFLRFLSISAICCAIAMPAGAVIVVNGVTGEDTDNAPPFQTLRAAVNYSNTVSDSIIEIQYDAATIPGFAITTGTVLNHPITIRKGEGYNTVIHNAIYLNPANPDQQITLENLHVSTSLGSRVTTVPLMVGCNVTATNCIFNSNPSSGRWMPAVSAAIPSLATTATLTLTSCTLRGHAGLEAGRSCRDYNIDRCYISADYSNPGPLSPYFTVGINNMRNFQVGLSSGPRMDEKMGLTVIDQPRRVNLSRSLVRGGKALSWPGMLNSIDWYENEHNCCGPIVATNTMFENYASPDGSLGQASNIGHTALPDDQNVGSTFIHCTFKGRLSNAFGSLYFPSDSGEGGTLQAAAHSFRNCFFDIAFGYGILNPDNSQQTVSGDGNSYNTNTNYGYINSAGTPWPPFETTQHDYFNEVQKEYTDLTGHLLFKDARIIAHSVANAPLVTTDFDSESRPMPVTALKSDIGADEINEDFGAAVQDWSIY